MPQKPEPKSAGTKADADELSIGDLDQVTGGKKLPGKRKPPTLTLKRGMTGSV